MKKYNCNIEYEFPLYGYEGYYKEKDIDRVWKSKKMSKFMKEELSILATRAAHFIEDNLKTSKEK